MSEHDAVPEPLGAANETVRLVAVLVETVAVTPELEFGIAANNVKVPPDTCTMTEPALPTE